MGKNFKPHAGTPCFIVREDRVATDSPSQYCDSGAHKNYWDGKTALVFPSESKAHEWAKKEGQMFVWQHDYVIVDAKWLGVYDNSRHLFWSKSKGETSRHNAYVALNGDGHVYTWWEGKGFGSFSGGTERGFQPIQSGYGYSVFKTRADAEKIGNPMKLVDFLVKKASLV